MSLDITFFRYTPILFAVTKRRGVDPIPFLFACAFVANIGSLILPLSNLTNLLLVNRLQIPFADFVQVMWLPNIVALITTLAMYLWLFRHQLSVASAQESSLVVPGVASGTWRNSVGAVLILVIAGLLIAGFSEQPIWIPAVVGAAILIMASMVTRRITLHDFVHDLSPSLFAFVIAMTMLVQALNLHVIGEFSPPVPDGLEQQIAGGVVVATLASNIMNNVPATVVIGELLAPLPETPREVLAYASLIGANLGPALTTYGSLATMLWLSLIRKRGTAVSTGMYMHISLITIPVVLITTSLALWIVLILQS